MTTKLSYHSSICISSKVDVCRHRLSLANICTDMVSIWYTEHVISYNTTCQGISQNMPENITEHVIEYHRTGQRISQNRSLNITNRLENITEQVREYHRTCLRISQNMSENITDHRTNYHSVSYKSHIIIPAYV